MAIGRSTKRWPARTPSASTRCRVTGRSWIGSSTPPLALRLTQPTAWRQFTLYRQVPASGKLSVTLALTGLGTAYFDDVRVEPLESEGALPPTARPPVIPVSRVQP